MGSKIAFLVEGKYPFKSLNCFKDLPLVFINVFNEFSKISNCCL